MRTDARHMGNDTAGAGLLAVSHVAMRPVGVGIGAYVRRGDIL